MLQNYSERTDLSFSNNIIWEHDHTNPPTIESSVIDIGKNQILVTKSLYHSVTPFIIAPLFFT